MTTAAGAWRTPIARVLRLIVFGRRGDGEELTRLRQGPVVPQFEISPIKEPHRPKGSQAWPAKIHIAGQYNAKGAAINNQSARRPLATSAAINAPIHIQPSQIERATLLLEGMSLPYPGEAKEWRSRL